ncbi:MAG: response regulator [Desulfococcaceae bacterium]|jgi:signal transduction histidine kinase|nr:response regulator [Desulfococcaceae bacterium]
MVLNESDVTILIIDDDPVVRESICVFLEDSGFNTLEAENGRIGLDRFRGEKQVDIILVDLRMPEVDGLDVLAAVTKESPETPIIVVSGTGVLQDAIEALHLGAWDYVSKPIQDMEVLEYAVRKALERAGLLVENRKYREHLESEIQKRTAELEERTKQLEIANQRLKEEMEEHQRAEARFRHAQKMEALGTLAGGIAHDFNNILFPIIGYTELMMDDVPENGPMHRNLEQILKAAFRAKELVSQILAFGRRGETEKSLLNIRLVVKEALKLLQATLPATIAIQQKIQKDCGSVLGNPTQIHQVMMNLCTNAYHAMREKGGVLSVEMDECEMDEGKNCLLPGMTPGNYVRIRVSDTGQGMDEDIREQIFDPYFTTKEPGEGTGLGLSVVHGIVKSHQGHISVQSRIGEGSVFEIYLPVVEKYAGRAPAESAENIPGGTENILLVDDEYQIVQMEKQMLQRMGYRVRGMTDSTAALELFRKKPDDFDLVITDMTMPGITGIQLAREILRIRPDIPLILCTGFSETISGEQARAKGIREYIMKPVLKREMAKTIRRVLDTSEENERNV